MSGYKGLHDPCPTGWKVCSSDNYKLLFTTTNYMPGNVTLQNSNSLSTDGGILLRYDNTNQNSSTYFRMSGFWKDNNTFALIGTSCLVWCRDKLTSNYNGKEGYHLRFDLNENQGKTSLEARIFANGGWEREALLIRCIQEQAD